MEERKREVGKSKSRLVMERIEPGKWLNAKIGGILPR